MRVRRLRVQHFRSHDDTVIDIGSTTTIITGKNGAGKTSLLEAIYIALRGSSFKGSDTDILRHSDAWWRVDLEMDDDSTRSVTFDPSRPSGKKQFVVQDKKSYRLSQKDKYPIVLFEPEHLRLLHGSPSRRREFIDTMLLQLDPTYATILRKYDRALKQRNTLLKSPTLQPSDLFVWNVALSEYGAAIIERRVYAIELLNQTINQHYQEIAHNNDDISLHYSHTVIDHSAQKLLLELEGKLEYDRVVKYTSVGSHRHDMIVHFINHPALSVASRGEVRSILIALKQIEAGMIEKLTGNQPIILLDDVFSDLDVTRQNNIAKIGMQTLITSTKEGRDDTEIKALKIFNL